MAAIGDLVRRDDHPDAPVHRSLDDPALRVAGDGEPAREYDYRRFRTTARRTGNFLRHLGVRDGATVAVADDPTPEAVFAFLGTALLGGTTRFGPPEASAGSGGTDARVLVAPTHRLGELDLPPGGQRVGYGDSPDDPSHHFFERDVWSENPGFPETPVDPESAALRTGDGRAFSHADLLAAAREVAADLDADDVVAVRASLADPGTVVAGLLAPLLVGACILLPDGSGDDDATRGDSTGTVAVVPADGSDVPEPRILLAADLDPREP